jgi:hypothetical protein
MKLAVESNHELGNAQNPTERKVGINANLAHELDPQRLR